MSQCAALQHLCCAVRAGPILSSLLAVGCCLCALLCRLRPPGRAMRLLYQGMNSAAAAHRALCRCLFVWRISHGMRGSGVHSLCDNDTGALWPECAAAAPPSAVSKQVVCFSNKWSTPCCYCVYRSVAGRSPGADPMRPLSAILAGLQLQPQQQQAPAAAPVPRPMSVLQSPGRVFAAAPSSAAQNTECLQTLLGLCTQLDR